MEITALFTTARTDIGAHDNASPLFTLSKATESTNVTDGKKCLNTMYIYESSALFQKYSLPYITAVGIPGNILSFLVWVRPHMLNSSGVYLAALAIDHLSYLVLYSIYNLEMRWGVRLLSFPGLCEIFTVLYYFFQYMDPLLVSAFSVERYISIYHPFKRIKYCTKKKATIFTLVLGVFSALLSAIQGYFWYYEENTCFIRSEVLIGGQGSVWQVWAIITELLSFFIVPMFVLLLNIRLLRYISNKQGQNYCGSEKQHTAKKSSAHTTLLLYVSYYFILTTLPVSVIYLLQLYFLSEQDCTVHLLYTSKIIIETIEKTHFALNFFIYFTTGAMFREETKLLLKINRVQPADVYIIP
ncbi:C-C chemokine receptor type 4-like [Ruditapes philippinarum]|uniref:C-C chemokine receptor type 4-like n=1 Tax=Ruditapes philippinarum TaxID=129788 RepID=UPI00295B57EC|nr:C-C chemokine receptor type 4-like [Ruditapes philippinarum]